jgi:hypothetical protein
MAKAPFWTFLAQSLALSAVVLAAWFAAGYGLVRIYGSLGPSRAYTPWVLGGIGLIGVLALVVVARHAHRRLGRRPPR